MEKKKIKTIAELKKSISESEANPPANEKEKNAGAPGGAETSAEPAAAEGDGGELRKRLEEAEARASESLDKYVRTLAEFDNFRKRTIKEKSAMYDSGVMDVAKALLPVIDSFERALTSCGEEEKNSSVYTGMNLIYKQMKQFMEETGITEIDALGCEFDPEVHSAVAHTDDPGYGENEIAEELQKGYMLKDKVLRHSMVKVAN